LRVVKNIFSAFIGAFFLTFLAGCSAEKNALPNIYFHNLTAHYNAYYYARNGIRSIESQIAKNQKDDYDHILPVYTPLDTAFLKQFKETLDDVIKKSSLIIINHKNSKWVDDAYDLLGLARLYGGEYKSAVETFKTVNTESKDDNMRHKALIHLMRTYIEFDELNNAEATSDYLAKEDLNKNNLKRLYLMRAYLYHQRDDLDNMVKNLTLAAPLLRHKDGSSKIFFIIGQIYQQLGFDGEAYNNYKKCLGNNPPYELSFYAKLNMAQVTELSNTSDVKRVRKYFRKLVSDVKNEEFKDKIFYEMGEFELKQGNRDLAINYYNQSIRSSTTNQRQKGLSYLRLGQINYDTLRNFEMAQAYYDSTIQVMPTTFERYKEVKTRKDVLDRFILNLHTINLQDSLINLSRMDSSSLVNLFTAQIEKKIEKEEQEREKAKKTRQSATSVNAFQSLGISNSSLTWYFNNPSAISLGQNEFKKVWGSRPLEDNWRRSGKGASVANSSRPVAEKPVNKIENGIEVSTRDVKSEVANIMKSIPFTMSARKESLGKVEESMFNLGMIYNFELLERENAISTFTSFLNRFPESQHEPEVLYTLYLILKEKEDAVYSMDENRLKQEHPKSTYARLLINPNYAQESSIELSEMKRLYAEAYKLYEEGNYGSSRLIINNALSSYEENEFFAHFKLLDILITGKTEDVKIYRARLEGFISNYPDTEITPFAKKLLDAAQSYEETLKKVKEAKYIMFTEDAHYFVLMVQNSSDDVTHSLIDDIEKFNQNSIKDDELKTGLLDFNDGWRMIVVSELDSKKTAVNYYDKFLAEINPPSKLPNTKFYNFIITKDNFDILYNSKDLDAYLKFFDESY